MAARRRKKDEVDLLEFHLVFNDGVLDELNLTPDDVKEEIDQFLQGFFEQRKERLKLLGKCKEGGSVHINSTLCSMVEWVIYNINQEDREAASFALFNTASSIHTLLLADKEYSDDTGAQLECLCLDAVDLTQEDIPDDEFFQEARVMTKDLFYLALHTTETTMAPDT